MKRKKVHASVKDKQLVSKRRNQIIKGAVALFKEKGFHLTTTREIAKAAGFSIGTLYEYIGTKEDVLYLVCDFIYDEVTDRIEKEVNQDKGNLESLKLTIAHYFEVMHDMQDEVMVMFQEVKSLSPEALPYVLDKEAAMVKMIEKVIFNCVRNEGFHLTESQIGLAAHNIYMQGQMWGFRRWTLQRSYSLDEYIDLQTALLIQGFGMQKKKKSITVD